MKDIDLCLELGDLIEHSANIKVDKAIFDDFIPGTFVNVQFSGANSDDVF